MTTYVHYVHDRCPLRTDADVELRKNGNMCLPGNAAAHRLLKTLLGNIGMQSTLHPLLASRTCFRPGLHPNHKLLSSVQIQNCEVLIPIHVVLHLATRIQEEWTSYQNIEVSLFNHLYLQHHVAASEVEYEIFDDTKSHVLRPVHRLHSHDMVGLCRNTEGLRYLLSHGDNLGSLVKYTRKFAHVIDDSGEAPQWHGSSEQ